MGFAANAIMDVVAPPPARGSNASADDASAPSFQDHVDASDQRSQRHDPPRSQRETRASSDRSSSTPPPDEANTAHPDAAKDDAKHDAEAPAAPINPPVLLGLIADATSAVLGAKAEQPAAVQQETAPADQAANSGATQAAALAAAITTPPKIASKAEDAPRTAHVKTAKGATAKTSAATGDAKTALAQTPATQDSTTQSATTLNLTPSVADSGAKSEENAKADGVEAVTSGSARSAQQSRQNTPPASAPAVPELNATPQQPEAAQTQTQTKDRNSTKASSPLDTLKQAVQDLAAGAPKAQPAPSAPPPAATHAQLAEPVPQAASDTSAARAPAAAQVGGEIIRRFNGHDTSFQLRLDPPELGRVDVRLDVSRDHRVTAVISADSPQALSDLARGARDLQQALQSAGLDLADDGLRFDLSSNGQGNSFAQAQAQQDNANLRAANAASETPIAPEVTASRPLSIDRWRGSRVDLVA
jgi:flagellar hook-length control protein FliK